MQHVHVAVLAHRLFCNLVFGIFQRALKMLQPHFHFDYWSFRLLLLKFELFYVFRKRLELFFLLVGQFLGLVVLLLNILQLH